MAAPINITNMEDGVLEHTHSTTAGRLWRVAVVGLAQIIGLVLGGVVVTLAGLTAPHFASSAQSGPGGMATVLGGLVLAAGTATVAAQIRGSFRTRWLILATFFYVCAGLNNTIEAAVFTAIGGTAFMVVAFLPCAILTAAAAAWLFVPGEPAKSFREMATSFFGSRRPAVLIGRVLLAILCYPLVYWVCGMALMAVEPGLLEFYRHGTALGLRIPAPILLLQLELGRSCLYLMAVLPLIICWKGCQRLQAFQLGLAFYALTGLSGMIQAVWMPPALRVGHGIELLADAVLYCWIVTRLLAPARPEPSWRTG